MTALEGFVPVDITKALVAFLDFCYIACQDTLTEDSLDALDHALNRFHHHRKIFQESGVRPTRFSLPHQHSLTHCHHHIKKFGAPNGLSSSITKSKHITAVKKPWHQSSRYKALGQMLTINTRNDKLAAARIDFSSCGMLRGTCLSDALKKLHNALEPDDCNDSDPDPDSEGGQDLDADEDGNATGPVNRPPSSGDVTLVRKQGEYHSLPHIQLFLKFNAAHGYPLASFWKLGKHIQQENLEELVWVFLYYQQNPDHPRTPPISVCPSAKSVEDISVFHSAKAVFCAPSNPSGTGGLYHKTIWCTPRWKTSHITAPRRDCVILHTRSDAEGIRGLDVVRVHLFFSFVLRGEEFECALVQEFCKSFTDPDPDNGLWVFEPDYNNNRYRVMSVVHLDSIVRAAHLLPVFKDDTPIPGELNFTHTLDAFKAFYLNKYIDYHAFKTLF